MSYSTKPDSREEHPLAVASLEHASKPALRMGTTVDTYSTIFSLAKSLALNLSKRGLQQGQIIALGELSAKEMIISIWACLLGGFVAFPMNIRFPVGALAQILKDINPTLVLSESSIPGYETTPLRALKMTENENYTSDLPPFDQSTAATLLMTSGSSGDVKIVQHSYHNHIESAKGSNQNIDIISSDGWVLSLPLYHVGGVSILFRCALSGASVIIPETHETTPKDIVEQSGTHISMVATQLHRFMQAKTGPKVLQKMKAILIGGGVITPVLIQKALDHQLPIHVSYGSTEMASQITTTSSDNREAALQNSGKILHGRDLIISHEGEILVKGETLAQGYVKHSQLLDLRDENGWFHTGDVGFINVHGELTVTGRLDNQFISGGENIQPEHIERLLFKITGIDNAIVLPRHDEEFGARPVAFLEFSEEAPRGGAISQQLRNHLPGYMIPIAYYEIPVGMRENSLKISRKSLSKLLLTENKHLHSLE